MLVVSPASVDFGPALSTHSTHQESLTVTNTLASPVVFSLRASAPARLSVVPAECSLEAGESISLQLKLRVPTTSSGASKQPRLFRDTLFLQSTYFQQKVNVTFGISGEASPTSAPSTVLTKSDAATPKGSRKVDRSVSWKERDDDPAFGPAGYRALLQAEFEEKSEKVLRVLESKDQAIATLEARLTETSVDLGKSREDCAAAQDELLVM